MVLERSGEGHLDRSVKNEEVLRVLEEERIVVHTIQ